MKSLVVLCGIFSLGAASITLGRCPVTGANNPDFDPELVMYLKTSFCLFYSMYVLSFQYLGDWYTYVQNYVPEGITCQRAQYGTLPDGTISVQNTVTNADGI